MNVLDEQMRADQCLLLVHWGIAVRKIGRDVAPSGIKDTDIIPFLQRLKRPTFFTHDQGFFQRQLAHARYCLAWLDVSDVEAATYIRRFLGHGRFDTTAKRMGIVARVHYQGVHFWCRELARSQRVDWED
jgi:hypothetical protein